MTSANFCYWLQGFFELAPAQDAALTAEQTRTIKAHLAMVFKHEIDPSLGTKEHQRELQDIHYSEEREKAQKDREEDQEARNKRELEFVKELERSRRSRVRDIKYTC